MRATRPSAVCSAGFGHDYTIKDEKRGSTSCPYRWKHLCAAAQMLRYGIGVVPSHRCPCGRYGADVREHRCPARLSMDAEVCICAATKLDDGRIIRGHRHDDCIRTAFKWKQAGQEIGRITQEQQGFMTSRNRFVDREEGARLMREARHVSAINGEVFTGHLLFSEDLY